MTTPRPRFVVGIDLGTTNSAVAYVDTEEGPDAPIRIFEIPQVVARGEVAVRPTLPSFLYLPAKEELPAGAVGLPWATERADHVVGEFARTHGWQVPTRLIASAKSWLCHTGIDRLSACLPWQAPAEVEKLSPVAASTRYLSHLREAWNAAVAGAAGGGKARRGAALEAQEIFLTVPASFDAAARDLTVRAAHEAGLETVTLIEEPQAAFYSWLGTAGEAWRKRLRVGDSVLVCDVGGGTTDFSLIAVTEQDGNLALERVAVGDHILLGGDNMDLTLAFAVRARLEAEGTRLDSWQLTSLAHSCRQAKEQLLGDESLEAAPVVVLGRGSKVIGGSIRAELKREDIEKILLDGFFPHCELGAAVARGRSAGLRELGLPFAQDPAVTRHLSHFIAAHRRASAVLFNGGVMKSRAFRRRVVEALDSWSDSPDEDLTLLDGTDFDVAVAHGAAYYGMVRRGRGVRIRGGTARAYYVGVESSMPAVPGLPTPIRALCVAPIGMEEGTESELPGEEFGLLVGEPVEFRFLSSSTRKADRPGAVVEDPSFELTELAPVATALGAEDGKTGEVVPVRLRSRVTEIGTLELWCVARDSERRWRLEYNLRESGEPPAA